MALKYNIANTEKMMSTFDFQGKQYSIDTIPEEARAAINSLNFVNQLKTELEAKKVVITKLLNTMRKKDQSELHFSYAKLNESETQTQLVEINNKLQVLDTARIAYSKQFQETLAESDS